MRILLLPVYVVWMLLVTVWYFGFFIKNRIDVVHPQSRDDFVAATLAAKLLGKKVIWTDHADLKHVYMNHKTWYKNPVGKLVYLAGKLADCVTLVSFSEKALIEQSLGKTLPNNYAVIRLGVVDIPAATKQKGGALVFIATSRLVADKGIGELIDAFKSLNNPAAILRLCGDGPDAAHFKTMAGDTKNIEFMGHVDDIAGALQQADVFVQPTYREGLGISVLEAERAGLPVIASNVDAMPEVVEDGVSGILVTPKNAQDLAAAMDRLAKNAELRTTMGNAGRQIYLDNFQLDKIAKEKFLPLYSK